MASDRSFSLGKSSEPTEEYLKFVTEAQRVYAELGSKKACQALIDTSPKLLLEQEADLKLQDVTGKQKRCKVYVFDKYLIVASQRLRKRNPDASVGGAGESSGMTTASSSDQNVVWFGSKASSTDKGVEVLSDNSSSFVDTPKKKEQEVYEDDSDDSVVAGYGLQDELMDLEEAEEEERRSKRKYNLKMWIDLRKIKATTKKLGSDFGIVITYVSKMAVQVSATEVKYETIVDQAQLWMENGVQAKTLLGIIQEAINKNTKEILDNQGKELPPDIPPQRNSTRGGFSASSASDSETGNSDGSREPNTKSMRKSNSRSNRVSESSTSTGSTRRKKRRNLARAKQTMRATAAYIANSEMTFDADGNASHANVLSMSDLNEKYKSFKADVDEGLEDEYVVHFKAGSLGFSLSSGSKIGPFICRLVSGGVAEISGVLLGDRVVAVNDIEIPTSRTWQECVEIIGKERKKQTGDLRISFLRKQKTEIAKAKKVEQEEEAKRLQDEAATMGQTIEVDTATTDDNTVDGTVQAVEDSSSELELDGKSGARSKMETIELRRKTDDGSNVPRFTLHRKKTGKRRFRQKMDLLNNMKYQVTNMKEFNEYKKNKATMVDLFNNIETLFSTVVSYLEDDKEKTCVYSLKEIYDTEYKYKTWLNGLREFHVKLSNDRRNVYCKDLKTGKPFCEHRRPKRMCSRISSTRENSVAAKDVDAIFLNIKPIMKSNVYLWNNLQSQLGALYEKLNGGTKVQVHELLDVFCKCFSEIAPFLQIYWQFCQRYTEACEKQKILRASNPEFLKVVEPLEKKHKMKLPNLLSKPVQRITRYHLLFSTLQKYAEKYVKEQENKATPAEKKTLKEMRDRLDKATSELQKIAHKVNLKVGEADSLDQMVEVFGEIGGQDGIANLLLPHRRFDSKVAVRYENESTGKNYQEAFLYLFNDMVAVALCKTSRNPSLFGGGGKFSSPFRMLKSSVGAATKGGSRSTSLPGKKKSGGKKKLSLMSGSAISPEDKRKSYRRPKKKSTGVGKKTPGDTSSSRDSKRDEYYEPLTHFYFVKVQKIEIKDKKVDDTDFFGVGCFYSRRLQDNTDETAKVFFYVETQEDRDKLRMVIEDLKQKDTDKRAETLAIREKLGGKKKRQRRFKKKHDKYKKESLEKGNRAKSSMYSGGSIASKKEV